MRELEVLVDGHLKLDFADIQEFFEQDLTQHVRSAIKRLIEQALLAERDRYLDLGYYEHAPTTRIDYRNGFYFRDLATKVGRHEGACVAEASAIYRANSKNEALKAFRPWKQHWEQRRPTAVACVEHNLEALLNFFHLPEAHWKKLRTTNVIERAFREVRRRTRPMSSFTNLASCDRIIYGVISHLNSSWEKKPFFKFTQNP
jgi:putative transposase